MVVILDDKAKSILEKFNLNIYSNIEEILELLFVGFSSVEIESVFVAGRSYNKLELICDNEKRFYLLFEYKNEFFKDCISLINDTKEMKYEFNYDEKNKIYSLNLLGIQIKGNDSLKTEVYFYGYGSHVNVYYKDRIYSFDIQRHEFKFDVYKFHEMISFLDCLDLENILQVMKLCVDMNCVDQLLIDEYFRNKLVKNMAISQNNITRIRLLKFKKKKC